MVPDPEVERIVRTILRRLGESLSEFVTPHLCEMIDGKVGEILREIEVEMGKYPRNVDRIKELSYDALDLLVLGSRLCVKAKPEYAETFRKMSGE
jgi:hypothetical protein